ncbi:hypothetical protein Hanom_Chr12g01178521 [Helianthus anomalus]
MKTWSLWIPSNFIRRSQLIGSGFFFVIENGYPKTEPSVFVSVRFCRLQFGYFGFLFTPKNKYI